MEKWGANYACSKWTLRRKVKALVEADMRKIRNDVDADEENMCCDVAAMCSYDTYEVPSALDMDVDTDTTVTSGAEQLRHQSNELCHDETNDAGVELTNSACAACYDSTESSCSSEDDADDAFRTRDLLAKWVALHNISGKALADLLAILIAAGLDLPKDPRTLLGTPVNSNVISKAGGLYYYFGVVDSVCQVLKCLPDSALNGIETLTLHVNIDGLPLFNSSTVSLWPILGMIRELPCEPLVYAVFSGTEKPKSAAEFLDDFVREMKVIEEQGFWYNGRFYRLVLDAIICDAPARAFVKCIKGHNGYNACKRCIQDGMYIERRMTYPEVDAKLRTDAEFSLCHREEHHTAVSPFSELHTVGCVTNFPLDYMHLVCLGVVRRTIMLWLNGPVKCRLSSTDVKKISAKLNIFRSHMPKEFCRRPRSLEEVRQWKATEFRQFIGMRAAYSFKHPLFSGRIFLSVCPQLVHPLPLGRFS